MGKANPEAVNQAYEKLLQAHHLVQDTVPVLTQCGPLQLLQDTGIFVGDKLSDITGLTAAYSDAIMRKE
ncbi:hypothetical protein JI721_05345 [Alicyclobacillus cycloheptanicus]|uniref:Uncharacterized protein n=1 Tax=Alicyclobacillus cycloheptanicus TaxID=1457 RepID=A0ABT9XMP9_9BACL|nr:hypothetical protein [Alicyclobacillus cycloheptanicus]MDQ0191594.1 hypothetical protein [Alicyclobacillus cycloheptanicus]WDM02240.1 hypothetical protein JI721_05345 [Alicyclobacillus cycloheptanicus]